MWLNFNDRDSFWDERDEGYTEDNNCYIYDGNFGIREMSMFTIIFKCLVINYRKEVKRKEVKRRGVKRRGVERIGERELLCIPTTAVFWLRCKDLLVVYDCDMKAGHVDVVCFYDKNIMLLTTLIWGLHKIL